MAIIGIVTGQFDILHPGYISLFQFAKSNCDLLYVFLNERPKNKPLPIFSIAERTRALMSLKYIHSVVDYQSESKLYKLLNQYKKQAHSLVRFLGNEYRGKDFTGKDLDIQIIYHANKNQWHYTEVLKRAHEKFLRIKEKDSK